MRDDIIVKGLVLASSPKTLFVKHTSLLTWAYYQAPLQQRIARDWVRQKGTCFTCTCFLYCFIVTRVVGDFI